MFKESDDVNFVCAMLKKQLGLTVSQQDIKLFDKSNFFEQLTFKAEVVPDDLSLYLDSYIEELKKHNAPYSETEVLRNKIKYFLKVYEKSSFQKIQVRGYHNAHSTMNIVDIVTLILSGSETLPHYDTFQQQLRKQIYQNRMSVDGKVLIARYALKQFFHSDFRDFINEFEKKISECLNNSLQMIKSVKDSFNRLGHFQYQRRVNDELTLHLELNTDEYPACMPDLYIGFKESEGTSGVYCDDEKLIRLYTCVSSGDNVPVMMNVRFIGSDGSVMCESSHGTFSSVIASGRVKICDRALLIHEAIEELREAV
ncbi:hypothetical protein EG703_04505 [Salmonella enterica]|nr:hypothetical protein [Salmonella enterica]